MNDIYILGAQTKAGNHLRFCIEVDDAPIYLTYGEFVIFGVLALRRLTTVDGWVPLTEFGSRAGNTRSHLYRINQKVGGHGYESDRDGNVRLATDKIHINTEQLRMLEDHRITSLLDLVQQDQKPIRAKMLKYVAPEASKVRVNNNMWIFT